MLRTRKKIAGFVFTFLFIAVALFGLSMGMDTRQDGSMTGCIFDQSVACPMNYSEHLRNWQETFIAARLARGALLALFVIFVFLCTVVIYSLMILRRNGDAAHRIRPPVFRQREIIAKLSDKILQALSDGALNPKRYTFHFVSFAG